MPDYIKTAKKQAKYNKYQWLSIILLASSFSTATISYWLLNSESGLQWLLSSIARTSPKPLKFEGIHGTFSNAHVEAIHFSNDELQVEIQDLKLNWQPGDLFSRKLLIYHLSAQNIEFISLSEDETPPLSLPENLHLPLSVTIQNINIGTLKLFSKNKEKPDFTANTLSVKLESDGQHHQLVNLYFASEFGVFSSSAQLDGSPPFNLNAQAKLSDINKMDDIKASVTGNLSQQLNIIIDGNNSEIKGNIDPFALTPISSLQIALNEFNPATLITDAPNTNLSLHTELHKNEIGQLAGEIEIKNHAENSLDNNGLPLLGIQAEVQLTSEKLQLNEIQVQIPDDGIISGTLLWHFETALGSADLAVKKLNPSVIDSRLKRASVNGTIKLSGDTETQNVVTQLRDGDLTFTAELTHTQESLLLKKLLLNHGQSYLAGQGELNLDNDQAFNFSGDLKRFNLADFFQGPSSDLNASLSLTGNLSPQVAGTLNYTINKSVYGKHPVSGNGKIALSDSNQLTGKAELHVGSNHLDIKGGFGAPGQSITINLNAPALAQIGMGLSGNLQAHFMLGGTFETPEIVFDINGQQLNLPGNQSLASLNTNGEYRNNNVLFWLNAENYRSEKETLIRHLHLETTGKKSKHQIQIKASINDDIAIQLHALGGLTETNHLDKKNQWTGKLSQLTLTGQIPAQLLVPTTLQLSSEQVSLGSTQIAVAGGQVNIEDIFWTPQSWKSHGHFSNIALHHGSDLVPTHEILHLGGKWNFTAHKQIDGQLHISREKGDWFFPGEPPKPAGIKKLEINAQVKNKQLFGELDLTSEHIGHTKAQINVPITYSEQNWTILPAAPLNGSVAINATDLSWIGSLMNESIKSDGQLKLQADLSGTLDKPELQGKIHGENLALILLDQGLKLEQGNLIANFDMSNLYVNQLNFISPVETPPKDSLLGQIKLQDKPGSLAISGTIGFSNKEHHLRAKLDHLAFAHPNHYWIIVSGNGDAQLGNNTLNIGGNITANAGILTQPLVGHPQLASDIIIDDQLEHVEQETLVNLVNIDAMLDLGKQFYLRVAGMEGRLAGQLRVQNDHREALNVTGSIAAHDTTFKAYGQQLEVKHGIVNFHGPIDDPGLNILAVREGLHVEAGVEVTGSVLHPKIRLVSTPTVSDTEKLSWLVLGRQPDASGLDTSLLLTAAGSILGEGSITDQISDALGVDEISFRQGVSSSDSTNQTSTGGSFSNRFRINDPLSTQAGSTDPLGNQIGTIGKRLSSRAYLSYERGLATTTAGVTKLTYNLTPEITVVTRAGIDSSVDMFYTFRFD